MNTPGQEGFWQMLRNEFKDLFHTPEELEEISDINIAAVYGLKVIEVYSKPHLISVAYIKDL